MKLWIRRALGVCLLSALLLIVAVPSAQRAAAAPENPEDTAAGESEASSPLVLVSDLLPDPRWLSDSLVKALVLDPGSVNSTGSQMVAAHLKAVDSERRLINLAAEQHQLDVVLLELSHDLVRLRDLRTEASRTLIAREAQLTEYAVSAFLGFGFDEEATPFGDDIEPADEYNARAGQVLKRRVDHSAAELRLARERVQRVEGQVAERHRLASMVSDRRDEATSQLESSRSVLRRKRRTFERSLRLFEFEGTEHLTIVADDAYVRAAEWMGETRPSCGLSWEQLAGIGRVESFHGFFGESEVDAAGQTSPKILGPVLDGDPWLAIADSDGGLLDEDDVWDRAVGPMQFIPTSWAIFAADGNRDGVEDPHNLFDAARAAARHLCGSGLETDAGFTRALLGYNRSVAYGNHVKGFAAQYGPLLPSLTPSLVLAAPESDGAVGDDLDLDPAVDN